MVKIFGHSKNRITHVGLIQVPDFVSNTQAKKWVKSNILDFDKVGIRAVFIGDAFTYYVDVKREVRRNHMF